MNLKNIYHLDNFRGEYVYNYRIPNWFDIEQYADICIMPYDIQSIINFIHDNDHPKMIILGSGSNVLLINRVHILLSMKYLNKISLYDSNTIYCEAGVLDQQISRFYLYNNFTGAEFLYTIPGTLGGNIKTNAGCYGAQISDIVQSLTYINNGQLISINNFNWAYRRSNLPENIIYISALLSFAKGDYSLIKNKMKLYLDNRRQTQPMTRTGGSTFINTPKYKAWELIEKVNLRGYKIGGAMFSNKHCNFIVNFNNATAEDIRQLIFLAESRIMETFNVKIKKEIIFI